MDRGTLTLHKLAKCRYIYIGETEDRGLGIFAAKSFARGEFIVIDEDGDYYDDVMTEAEALRRGHDLANDCFQVGIDRYLLPNGNIDDFVNHSCRPNTGLRLTGRGYRMMALAPIETGDELTYDYSTYIANPRETLRCACGAPACRGLVGRFADLPDEVRRRYLRRGVVGAFVLDDETVDAG